MLLPPPHTLDLPRKFTSWRQNQDRAIDTALSTPKRFIAQVCPTGFGKSLAYMGVAQLTTGRTVVLTSSKGLQNQLSKDFNELDIVDIRGRNSYRCVESSNLTCDQGPCINGYECKYKQNGCQYYDKIKQAKRADIVITNYAYWMTINKYGEGLGKFELIVCDEAHGLPDLVSGFLSIELNRYNDILQRDLRSSGIKDWSISKWREWAIEIEADVEDEIERCNGKLNGNIIKRVSKLKKIKSELGRLGRVNDEWIIEVGKYIVTMCPVWPREYTEDVLFLGIGKVMLTSATIRMKTIELLGIDVSGVEMIEYPHTFPIKNRQLIWVPTVRMHYNNSEIEIEAWARRIYQIVKKNIDCKGIIHSVSYKRRDVVINALKDTGVELLTHSSKNTEKRVNVFKGYNGSCVLVSPSVTTGYDFPGDECRWQVVGKVPYPNTQSRLMKARDKEDKDYSSYVAMQQLVQTCGRGVRSKSDYCKTYVIDDNIEWFFHKYKRFAPEWFYGSLVKRVVI